MAYTLFLKASFGGSKTGIGTVGYTLLDTVGAVYQGRSTTGVIELGGGDYGAPVALDDDFRGTVKWDTGGGSPVYAFASVNPEATVNAKQRTRIAWTIFALDLSTIEGNITVAARSLLNAVRALRNKVAVALGVMTVYKEDDLAVAWTATVASDATANPITTVDPA